MKFLYKIHSGYDGFSPKRIPQRLQGANKLGLWWDRYIEDVQKGDEVWVFFHGPHRFRPGVYIEGVVTKVDLAAFQVTIRVRRVSTEAPLTDDETSDRVAQAVATRFRQVFLFPEEWAVAPDCDINAVASSCARRQCENCPTWKQLYRIKPITCGNPARLTGECQEFAPAFWVIPSRSYYVSAVGPRVRRTSELFSRFKTGQETLAYPLALGMFYALRKRGDVDFDCIIPIPLSPAKVARGEIHRTRLLAQELGKLLGCPVEELLSLNRAISKRAMFSAGYSRSQFEAEYYLALEIDNDKIKRHNRVLLVDDVCTEGTTLRCAIRRIMDRNNQCEVSAATAGQMVVKAVVRVPPAIEV